MSTVVLIPALNEEASIGKVIEALPRDEVSAVVVIDNGSTDQTAERARQAGAEVVAEPRRGYGQACLTGIAHVMPRRPDVIVFLDGDFSDHPEQVTRLVEPIVNDRADLVIGSRMRGQLAPGAMLPQARFGNWLAGRLLRWGWGADFTDLGPFRAIRSSALERLGMQDTNYGWTVEMQVRAVEAGLRCLEVPVDYRPRIGTSKITGTLRGTLGASYKILKVIGGFWLSRGRRSYD